MNYELYINRRIYFFILDIGKILTLKLFLAFRDLGSTLRKHYPFCVQIYADDESVDTDIEDYISGCIGVSTYYLDSYFRKIFKNYEHYKNCLNKTSKEKCCRFFGYWIQSQRKSFEINPSYRISEWDKCFPIFWKKLNQKNQKSDEDCNFIDKNNYSHATIKIKRYIDELHSIKGFLDDLKNISSKRNKCLLYNTKRDNYIKDILKQISTITNFKTLNNDMFIIDDKCSLQNFFRYFRDEECPEEPNTEIQQQPRCDIPEHQLLLKQPTCPDLQAEVKSVEEITETTPTPSRSQNYLFVFLTFLGTLVLCFLIYNVKNFFHLKICMLYKKINMSYLSSLSYNTFNIFNSLSIFLFY
ncbi:hypothetical protein PVMG_05799 [Plasmodium vivax Mauritania I]|uniref:Uncharacterized protein n=1 Tax=Plasmodium vivax Mauritania I TaxID=1035515 RepID=A0A0J9TL58_PLAVI|nr:hypothetical protein PVMG_05799 [Plasmodium vivax Mauritania I]